MSLRQARLSVSSTQSGRPGCNKLGQTLSMIKNVVAKKVVRKRRPRGSGKLPTIAARLPQCLISQIDRYAKERNIPRSEALREIVVRGLADLKSRAAMGRCAGVRYRRGTNDPRLPRSVLRPIDGTTRWTGANHRERGRLRHRKSRRTQGAGEMFDWAQLRGHGRSRFV